MTTAPELAPAAHRVRRWLCEAALPLWASSGVEPVHGGFREHLTREGQSDGPGITRLRVQARQIYVFSHAAVLGWTPGLETARRGFEFLVSYGWCEQTGGWYHRLTAEGAVHDDRRDTYDQAFVLFALAWYYRAAGDARALALIERTLLFLDTALADATHGGYREGLPHHPPRRQNPHMHLLEAMLALHDATGSKAYAVRAAALVDLFASRFVAPEGGFLREFFEEDWHPARGGRSEVLEPGHHYEWVWLLSCYGRAGSPVPATVPDGLFSFAENKGRVAETGLVLDAVGPDGAPQAETCRLWPQTERLRALVVRYRAGQTPASAITGFVETLFAYYLDEAAIMPGLWVDRRDYRGQAVAGIVPASTFYHLFGAFAALMEMADGVTLAQEAP